MPGCPIRDAMKYPGVPFLFLKQPIFATKSAISYIKNQLLFHNSRKSEIFFEIPRRFMKCKIEIFRISTFFVWVLNFAPFPLNYSQKLWFTNNSYFEKPRKTGLYGTFAIIRYMIVSQDSPDALLNIAKTCYIQYAIYSMLCLICPRPSTLYYKECIKTTKNI